MKIAKEAHCTPRQDEAKDALHALEGCHEVATTDMLHWIGTRDLRLSLVFVHSRPSLESSSSGASSALGLKGSSGERCSFGLLVGFVLALMGSASLEGIPC